MEYTTTAWAAAGLALLALFSYLAAARRGPRTRRRYPPVSGTVFHKLYHFRRLHDYLTALSRRRKTFRLLAPGLRRRLVYTCDPAVVEHILRARFGNYGKGSFNGGITRDLLGDGIFAVDGDRWRQQRAIAAHELSSSARELSGAVFRRNAARLAAAVSAHHAAAGPGRAVELEFQGMLQRAAMDSIFAVTFGSDLDTLGGGGEEASRFVAAVDDASEFTLLRYVNPFWKAMRLLNVGPEAALRERVEVIDEFVYGLIRARSEELTTAAAARPELATTAARQDMLSRFMEAAASSCTNATGGDGGSAAGTTAAAVDDKYLRDMVLNMLIAGKDTTAEALAWFFYMACKHPRVQERVYHEAVDASGGAVEGAVSVDEFARSLTDEALGKMHYLHAALTETLRLFPALPLNNKECFSDDVLPGGFSVGKGDIVFYVPYAMGRMEYLWGEDAEAFRPERWVDDNGEFQQESAFKFTAFQAGPRICLGKEFAYRQMKVLAAVLLRFFVFRLRDEGGSVTYRATITLLIEDGLHLTAMPR